MSIDFVARISRPAICREFVHRLHEVAGRLAGFPCPSMRIVRDPEGREDFALEDLIGVEGHLFFLKVGNWESGLSIGTRTYSRGEPGVTEDLEGHWVSASFGGLREPWQFVAALAAVIALAELGQGRVVDEAGFWSAGEEENPLDLLERISAPTASPNFESGAAGLKGRILNGRDSRMC